LLGVELGFLADGDADAHGAQEVEQLGLVLQVGAGGVAEGISGTSIAMANHFGHGAVVLVAEAELSADARVHVFGHGLGQLDAETEQAEIVAIAVGQEPLALELRRAIAHGHHL
jgi:hypothetical protein